MGETIVNEYWMYENEPFHLIRFTHNGIRYLIGKDIQESAGVTQSRRLKGYAQPSDDVIKEYFGV